MQRLLDGHRRFVESQDQQLFKRLAEGQAPEALLITCSDSRINPDQLFDTEPGTLFVIRNAGNIVPPYHVQGGGEAATVDFAVAHLKVPNIIVMGHSHCAAAGEWVTPQLSQQLPRLGSWLKQGEGTLAPPHRPGCTCQSDGVARVTHASQQNVLLQLQHLRTYPLIQAALAAQTCTLHAWFFELETGRLQAFDAHQRTFLPLPREMAESVT